MTDLLPWNISKFSSNIVTILVDNVDFLISLYLLVALWLNFLRSGDLGGHSPGVISCLLSSFSQAVRKIAVCAVGVACIK